MNTPVLFLVFNRPEHTAQVFNTIRDQKPRQLFISADGPRKGHNDEELCNKVRNIVSEIDWPCEVHRLFRDTNLGCGLAVSGAINWFFDHVEQGIILEDDCLPDQSFFPFCETLLNKYANNKDIMAISGTNFLPKAWKNKHQSYFFAHVNVWGWATWKRAWKFYDYDMPSWNSEVNKRKIRKRMKNNNWYNYYLGMFEGAYNKEINTWDLQWVYCVLNNNGLSINPSVNLVRNIGFGLDGTHTNGTDSPFANMHANQIFFPLKHPSKLKIDRRYLRASYRFIFSYKKSFASLTKSWLRLYYNRMKKNKS